MNKILINKNENILGGTPVFKGTRVPIKNLFDYIEGGQTIDDFLQGFPSVRKNQVIEILRFSEKLVDEDSARLEYRKNIVQKNS